MFVYYFSRIWKNYFIFQGFERITNSKAMLSKARDSLFSFDRLKIAQYRLTRWSASLWWHLSKNWQEVVAFCRLHIYGWSFGQILFCHRNYNPQARSSVSIKPWRPIRHSDKRKSLCFHGFPIFLVSISSVLRYYATVFPGFEVNNLWWWTTHFCFWNQIKLRPNNKQSTWSFKAYNWFTQRWRINNVSVLLFRWRNAVKNNWFSQIIMNLTVGISLQSKKINKYFFIKLSSVKGHQDISFLLQKKQINEPHASQNRTQYLVKIFYSSFHS